MNDEWTLEDLLRLADAIGERIADGRLPKTNEHGQYVFADRDLELL